VTLYNGTIQNGTLTGSTYTTYNGSISANLAGAGALTKGGTGAVTLSGTNSYSGGTTVTSGNLTLGSSTALGSASGSLTVNGGNVELNGNNIGVGNLTGLGGNIHNDGSSNVTFTIGNGNATGGNFAGSIANTDSGGTGLLALVKVGNGTQTLSGANTYGGGTIINAGTLALSGVGTFGNSTNALTVSGGTADLGSTSQTLGSVTLNNGAIQNGTLTGSSYTTYNGSISAILAGNTSTLTQNGSGTTTLSNANTYGGGTFVNGGTLAVSGSGTFGNSTNALTVSGGTADLGGTSQTVGNVALFSGAINNGNLTGTSYSVQSGSIGAALKGSATLGKTTGGTVTLSGNNTYSGGTQIFGGTLAVTGGGTLGSSSGALGLSGGSTVLDLGGTNQTVGAVTLTDGTIQNGTLTGASFDVQNGAVSAVLAGSAGLTKNGTGTVVLSNSNTYTGGTVVNNGVLQLNTDQALGSNSTSGTTVNSGGALLLNNVAYSNVQPLFINGVGSGSGALLNNGTSSYAGPITASTNATINAGGGNLSLGDLTKNGTVLTLTGGGVVNVNGVVSGTAVNSDLNVVGTTVNLNSANTYNGPTNITSNSTVAGVINANIGGALPVLGNGTRSDVSLTGDPSHTAQLNLVTGNQQISSLTGDTNSVVNLNSNTLTIGNTGTGTTTFGGNIGGSGGSLVKDGSSTQILNGNNSYSGSTTVTGGTLIVNGSLASSSVSVSNGATLGGTAPVASIGGLGTIAPGASNSISNNTTSAGILTASTLALTSGGGNLTAGTGTSFQFELFNAGNSTSTVPPTWNNASASGNDVLHLTAASSSITGTADASNLFDIYLGVTSLAYGDTFTGGVFAQTAADLASLANGTYAYYILGTGPGSVTYNGNTYVLYTGPLTINEGTTLVASADFGSGTITNGYSQQFTVVPEPGTWSMFLGGALALFFLKRGSRRGKDEKDS